MINKEILIKYNLIVTAQISLSTSVNIPGLEKKKRGKGKIPSVTNNCTHN